MTNNAVLRVASKKTIVFLLGVATLGAGLAGTTAVFANTGAPNAVTTSTEKPTPVTATAPTQDYAKNGTFTSSTGDVKTADVTSGKGAGYKAGTADSYWLQVDLGKARTLTGVSIKFLDNSSATGFIQYTNNADAAKDPASTAWTDFTTLNGVTGTYNAPAGANVVKARYVRVLVNKTTVAKNAPAGTKAEDVAGIADFQVDAETVYATGFEVKGLENIAQTHYGDHVEFTTKATPGDADVNYDTTGTSGAFNLTKGKTDADGTTHWTLDVVRSTAGEEQPIVIKNTVVKATDKDGKNADGYQTVYEGKSSSWAYAKTASLAAPEGNQTLFIGDTANGGNGATLIAAIAGEDGQAAKQDFDVVSDNSSVVAVNKVTENGYTRYYAQGKGVGSAQITVTAKDVRKGAVVNHTLNFESKYQSATGFTDIKAPSEITLGASGENKISAKVTPEDTANQKLTFKSSDDKTLTVSEDGTLTPHVEGLGNADSKQVSITVTAPISAVGETPKTFTQTITVQRPAVTSVKLATGLNNNAITLGDATEKGIAIKATVSPEFSNPAITWASNNTKVATVDNAGSVKFTGTPGFVAITATSAHGVGGSSVTGTALINVVRPAVKSLVAYKASDKAQAPVTDLAFDLGKKPAPVDLNVKASPKYADDSVYWITGNANVASVDASTGVVTAYGPGSTTVTAVSKVDGTIQARVNVKVTAPKPKAESVKLVAPKDFASGEAKVGDEIQLDTVVTPTEATAPATWSSSDPTVASVSPTGKVTAVKPGNAVITAAVDGVTASYPVTVAAAEPASGPTTAPTTDPTTDPDAKPDDSTTDSKVTLTLMDDHNPEGGYLKISTENNPGEVVALATPTTDVKGYTFKGWATDKERTKFVKDIAHYTVPDEDTTLYAAWADKDGNIYTPSNTDDKDAFVNDNADTPSTTDGAKDNGKKQSDEKTATQPSDSTPGNTGNLAKTGAAVGIFGAIAAALTGAGVSLKRFSKRHAE